MNTRKRIAAPRSLVARTIGALAFVLRQRSFARWRPLLALALTCGLSAAADEGWDPQFVGTNAPDAWVAALAFSGTNLYVGGAFTTVGGVTVNRTARWDGRQWAALGSGVSGNVFAIATQGTNVFFGGGFSSAGGVANTKYIARWDGQSWNALGAGMNSTVYALAVSGTNLFAGGRFSNPGPRIARWDGSTWLPLGGGVGEGAVYALAFAGANVFIGGEFDTVNNAAGYNNAARWNGSAWSKVGYYGGYGVNNPVLAMTAIGQVAYFGGDFTKAGGGNAGYLAKWDGSSWSGVGGGLDYWVTALANDGTNLYVGGRFTNAGPTRLNGVAKWDGAAWSPLGSGLNRYPNALAVSGNDLYAGGDFTNAGGEDSYYIAHWGPAVSPSLPRLSIRIAATNTVVLSWPASAEGWVLETTNILPQLAAPWPQIAPPYQTNGTDLQVTEPLTAGNHFFRLRKP